MNRDVLADLYAVIEARKTADPKSSYIAGLYARGLPAIARKVMEESYEAVEAALLSNATPSARSELIHEVADLWFHTLVLASQQGLQLEEILQELEKRMGKSGYQEKQDREERRESSN